MNWPSRLGLVLLICSAASHALAQTVTLEGETRLPRLTDGQVTIQVGATSLAGTTDAQGKFSVDLDLSPSTDLVQVQVCGTASQSGICHVRLLDTAAGILSKSDQSGQLGLGTLSPLSTATWGALVKSLPNQNEPMSLSEIENYLLGFESVQIINEASLISLVAKDFEKLPTGADSLVDLALSNELLGAVAGEFTSEQRSIERRALVQIDSLMKSPSSDFDPSQESIFIPIQQRDGNTRAFSLNLFSSGDGQYTAIDGSGDIRWENAEAGEVIFKDGMEQVGTGTRFVSLTDPVDGSVIPATPFFFFPPGEFQTVEGESRLLEVRWRELDVSELLRVGLITQIRENLPPEDRPDISVDDLDLLGIQKFTSVAVARDRGAIIPSVPMPSSGSTWAFPRCDTDCKSDAGNFSGANLDLIQFQSSGIATSSITDPGLSWEQFGNEFQINQVDGIELEILPFGGLETYIGDVPATRVLTIATRPDGQRFASSHLAMQADPSFSFSESSVVGRYQSMAPFGAVFDLETGGTGWAAFMDDPTLERPASGGWDIEWEISTDGDLVLAVKPRDSTFVQAWWVFRPVRSSAEGFYAIERLVFGERSQAVNSAGTLLFWDLIE